MQRDSDVGLKIHSFRQMFGHQSKRMKTGVHIQPVSSTRPCGRIKAWVIGQTDECPQAQPD
ncbi:hypothetical protein NXW89_00905 [Bacteroides thetaiotaomicron]|nr:hypothetical protein [Bacteroides thetaiotaomicron]